MKRATVTLLVLSSCLSSACYWDSDTLRAEALSKGDLVAVLTGRFERNPPLYYEMRIKRVLREVEKSPSVLEHYDDLVVALDRLGRHDEALAWSDRKAKRLKASPQKNEEHWYRYHANRSTVLAHRWFSKGAKRDNLKDLTEAAEDIDKAIGFNPDAHFGRETYQDLAIRWLLSEEDQPLHETLGLSEAPRLGDPVEGLSGLIRLGAGWESPDLFGALGTALSYRKDANLAELAKNRALELIAAGKNPIKGERNLFGGTWIVYDSEARFAKDQFAKLRANADKWHQNRTEFMLARMKSGMHPDTHPDFWTGYVEVEPLEIEDSGTRFLAGLPFSRSALIWNLVAVCLVLVGVFGALLHMRRARLRSR